MVRLRLEQTKVRCTHCALSSDASWYLHIGSGVSLWRGMWGGARLLVALVVG